MKMESKIFFSNSL